MAKPLAIATALIRNAAGQVLLVRKQNTRAFMQPGGKIDAGETSVGALLRELEEELGLKLRGADLSFLGHFEAEAAHEAATRIAADLYALQEPIADQAAQPAQEIAEVIWVNPRHTGLLPLAPFTRDTVLPLAILG